MREALQHPEKRNRAFGPPAEWTRGEKFRRWRFAPTPFMRHSRCAANSKLFRVGCRRPLREPPNNASRYLGGQPESARTPTRRPGWVIFRPGRFSSG